MSNTTVPAHHTIDVEPVDIDHGVPDTWTGPGIYSIAEDTPCPACGVIDLHDLIEGDPTAGDWEVSTDWDDGWSATVELRCPCGAYVTARTSGS